MSYFENRDNLRIGDEVNFYEPGDRGCYVIGIVEKINRKSIKVRQTNDSYRFTKAAFGHWGGNKVGGKDFQWTVVSNNLGQTILRWTERQKEAMHDSPRGIQMRRAARQAAYANLVADLKRYARQGVTREDILKALETEFADSEAVTNGIR